MSDPAVSQPITFANGVTAPNRILKSAMTERLCSWGFEPSERGKPTAEYLRLYEEWGAGGTGIIVLGNIPCDYRYPEAISNACIDPNSPWDQVAAFKPVIKAAKAHGALCIGQITHAGRQTSDTVAPVPVAPSSVQSKPLGGMSFGLPRALEIEEIEDIVKRFAFAAKVLHDAGADGCQLHCAHGYLLSQFLSPVTNKRDDKYGGSFENRSRIHFEIIKAIREKVPDENFMLTIKINSADFKDGGFGEEESRKMCKMLEDAGVTLIELSGGTYESMQFFHKKESTKKRESYFIEFAEQIRPNLSKAKLAVTGGFRSRDAMSKAIKEGSCDICGVARPLTAQTDFSKRIIEGQQDAAPPNYAEESTQTAASYVQIGEIGKGKPPSDLSNKDVAKKVDEMIQANPAAAFRFRAGGSVYSGVSGGDA